MGGGPAKTHVYIYSTRGSLALTLGDLPFLINKEILNMISLRKLKYQLSQGDIPESQRKETKLRIRKYKDKNFTEK